MQDPRDSGGKTTPPGPVRSGERMAGQALPAGTRLRGYTLGRVLGSGGFGITYLAEHGLLRRMVAIKEHFPFEFARRDGQTVRPSEASAPTYEWARTRFLEEARMLARLKHPSIVEVVDVFEANGTAYMVLAYQEGPSMKDWVAGLGRAPTQAELDALLKPLLGALETIHAAGMLHRDIAPDNIIIRAGGDPCLLDFGAAREALRQQSRALSAIVKSGFSPPEQYTREARSQGAWTDIYALGATLYFAVTGERPPEATERMLDDIVISTAAKARGPYRSTFLDAIDWALRVKPAERPQTVAAWQASLLSDRPVGAATRRLAQGQEAAGRPLRTAPAGAPKTVGPSGGRPADKEVPAEPARRSGRGMIAAAIAGLVVLAASGGGYAVHRSIVENRAAAEWVTIAETTDIRRLSDFAQRHARTSYGPRANERLARLQSASAAEAEAARRRAEEAERQRERVAAEQRERVAAEQRRAEERRKEESERQRLAEERRKEAERQAAAERQRQAEERARLEAERLRLAEEQRRKEEAERQRLAEEQRRKEEAERQRLAEEQRRREAEKASTPPPTAEVKPPPPSVPPQTPQIALLPNVPPPAETPPTPPAVEPKTPEPPPAPSRAELARQIKQSLKLSGCYTGAVDSSWRRQVRVALANYARHAKVTFSSDEPVAEVLALLTKRTGRVCPLECDDDEIEVKGRCVAKPKTRKEQRQEEAKSKPREAVRKPQAETKAAPRETAKAAPQAKTGENVYRCDNWNKTNTTCTNRRGQRCWHSGFRWVCS